MSTILRQDGRERQFDFTARHTGVPAIDHRRSTRRRTRGKTEARVCRRWRAHRVSCERASERARARAAHSSLDFGRLSFVGTRPTERVYTGITLRAFALKRPFTVRDSDENRSFAFSVHRKSSSTSEKVRKVRLDRFRRSFKYVTKNDILDNFFLREHWPSAFVSEIFAKK